ncbi:MAG TPA: hypothetical protein VF857_01200 [Spirochaetota bacterium]
MQKIIGHKKEKETLFAILSSGMIPHAFLFSGNAGIGKRMLAHSFLRALFCEAEKKPCGVCPSCRQVEALTHPDVVMIAPNENGTLPIGDPDTPEPGSVRYLIQRMSMRSVSGRTGVIIDGIERATNEAQNALLKTLEEPPSGSCIILISSDRSGILPTIQSRVREIRFAPLSSDDLRLIVGDRAEGDILDFVVSGAGGSASTALELCNADMREKVLSLCRSLSAAMTGGGSLAGLTNTILPKPKGGIDILDILIQIYRVLLASKAKDDGQYSSLLDDIYIDDIDTLRTIIKLLFATKKGRGNNINTALQLRALAYYALHSKEPFAPPFAAAHSD